MASEKALDREFTDDVVAEVSESRGGWTIKQGNGLNFGVDRPQGIIADPDPIVIRPGDNLRIYGSGVLGDSIRGLDVNERNVFYRTVAEDHAHWRAQLDAMDAERRREWEADWDNRAAQIDALPREFRFRHARFCLADSNGRHRWEPYELFVATEAVKLTQRFSRPGAVRWFSDLPYAKQRKAFPGLSEDHSGNTLSWACRLAYVYLKSPGQVETVPPALSPIAGDWAKAVGKIGRSRPMVRGSLVCQRARALGRSLGQHALLGLPTGLCLSLSPLTGDWARSEDEDAHV